MEELKNVSLYGESNVIINYDFIKKIELAKENIIPEEHIHYIAKDMRILWDTVLIERKGLHFYNHLLEGNVLHQYNIMNNYAYLRSRIVFHFKDNSFHILYFKTNEEMIKFYKDEIITKVGNKLKNLISLVNL